MPFAALLFADGIDVTSRDYQNGALIGAMVAGVLCGLWPLLTGFNRDRPVIGIVGFFACVPSAFFAGCLLAVPVAFVFRTLIVAIGPPNPPRDDYQDGRYDPYARGRRSEY